MDQKKQIQLLTKKVTRIIKRIPRLEAELKNALESWQTNYDRYEAYSNEMAEREEKRQKEGNKCRLKASKEIIRKLQYIKAWPKKNKSLQERVEKARKALKEAERLKNSDIIDLEKMKLEWQKARTIHDDMIMQMMFIADNYLNIQIERNSFLSQKVFPFLYEAGTKTISLVHSNGLFKIEAKIPNKKFLIPDLAHKAMQEIDKFYARYMPEDSNITDLLELTQSIIEGQTNFKPGNEFNHFINKKIDIEKYPELVKAQEYLKISLASEETNPSISIFVRNSKKEKWERKKQVP